MQMCAHLLLFSVGTHRRRRLSPQRCRTWFPFCSEHVQACASISKNERETITPAVPCKKDTSTKGFLRAGVFTNPHLFLSEGGYSHISDCAQVGRYSHNRRGLLPHQFSSCPRFPLKCVQVVGVSAFSAALDVIGKARQPQPSRGRHSPSPTKRKARRAGAGASDADANASTRSSYVTPPRLPPSSCCRRGPRD